MIFEFSRELYDKEVLLAASYAFTDKAYIHLDMNSEKYIVDIVMKKDTPEISEKAFCNEIIAQSVRKNISAATKVIRELIMARAFSSTVIDEVKEQTLEDSGFLEQDIIGDWFEKYGKET